MPWRLIGLVIVFAIFLAFITFNLGNKCDISFGFITFNEVPVFLTAFASFFFGMFCAIPVVISAERKRREKLIKNDVVKPLRKWGKKKDKASEDEPAPLYPVDDSYSGKGF
ncbi:MAG: hypothetical protein FWG99_02820 [Treponema sp.]|nr:hypothetical protein [Treponema sp.]